MSNDRDSATGRFEKGNSFASAHSAGGAPEGNSNSSGNSGGGPPEGNQNAARHHVFSDPGHLYDSLDDPEGKEWIRNQVERYLSVAPFGIDDPRADRLGMTVVMMYQEWRARAEVEREGMAVEKVVGRTDEGEPITDDREHHLLREAHRLNDRIRLNLKKLELVGTRSDIECRQPAERSSLAGFISTVVDTNNLGSISERED